MWARLLITTQPARVSKKVLSLHVLLLSVWVFSHNPKTYTQKLGQSVKVSVVCVVWPYMSAPWWTPMSAGVGSSPPWPWKNGMDWIQVFSSTPLVPKNRVTSSSGWNLPLWDGTTCQVPHTSSVCVNGMYMLTWHFQCAVFSCGDFSRQSWCYHNVICYVYQSSHQIKSSNYLDTSSIRWLVWWVI